DEPSDFEWRNLKKLTVLVLSSLVWKNTKVQDQVREYGGLEALVSCCRPDESNPYIREHAIMCLRFAVEGNEKSKAVMRGLAKRGGGGEGTLPGGRVTMMSREEELGGGSEGVVREVLDQGGYETFVDGKGQVVFRRKEEGGRQQQLVGHAGTGPSAQAGVEKAVVPSHNGGGGGGGATNSGVSKPPLAPPRLSPAKMTAEKAAELMQN
ncbi:hypothetical protein LTR53_018592, partial [Teratosphaeriaceae sp. CCFEE 6253]